MDGLLAATAKVVGLTLITRNVADVAGTGVGCSIRSAVSVTSTDDLVGANPGLDNLCARLASY
jgi:hypothetical protein